jgi:hypothetical protein
MAKKALAIVIVWLASMVCAHADSGPHMQEGLWEITTELEMPGMPMKMPPTTFTQCIKKDQMVPMDEKPDQKCKIKDVSTKGNTTRWTVECSEAGGQMTGKGMVTYHGDKMEGNMSMQTQGMTMTSRYKGRRVGACDTDKHSNN